jgi:hypothetical protein
MLVNDLTKLKDLKNVEANYLAALEGVIKKVSSRTKLQSNWVIPGRSWQNGPESFTRLLHCWSSRLGLTVWLRASIHR